MQTENTINLAYLIRIVRRVPEVKYLCIPHPLSNNAALQYRHIIQHML